jgi:pimeloyl-ACP methyl ester carboxylesterase
MIAMAAYVQLGDVRTWYDEHGEGEPLALLHPGGADPRAWTPNLDALAALALNDLVVAPNAAVRTED